MLKILIYSLLVFIPSSQAAIQFVDVPANKRFPDSRESGSIRFACAASQDELAASFAAQGLRFDASLVRVNKSSVCHIHYVPTLKGFRAHPDSVPARQIFLDLEHKSLLGRRTLVFGDSIDMAKAILAELPRPLDVALSVPLKVKGPYYENALRHYFPEHAGQIWLRDRPVEAHQTWAQDYMKSGDAAGETRVLMPRRAFEGQAGYGETFNGLLKSFSQRTWVRSKLAWEGGDLIFAHDPRDPSRLLLFFGDAARPYWGSTLTGGEYGYVLATEFGADSAVYMGGIAPHVDYFVSFLPEDNIALAATPLQEDFELSRNALELLLSVVTRPLPPVLERLRTVFETRESSFGMNAELARALIAQARAESPKWATPVSADLYSRLTEHISDNCARDAATCLSEARLPGLIENQPGLMRDWVEFTFQLRTAEMLPRALLSIMESQIPGSAMPGQAQAEEKIRELRDLGYTVIRVPSIGADFTSDTRWAGISYVNSALIDRTLFVPFFGLGAPELRILNGLVSQLPRHYRVVPVYARYAQLHNGGAHCILAFIRDARAVAPMGETLNSQTTSDGPQIQGIPKRTHPTLNHSGAPNGEPNLHLAEPD
ncbi:MAG: hypothetical protein IH602_01650 [Bryobacteraceae bacterium]|nr:hypothetical protein [Bryobacteraceae bacterium]